MTFRRIDPFPTKITEFNDDNMKTWFQDLALKYNSLENLFNLTLSNSNNGLIIKDGNTFVGRTLVSASDALIIEDGDGVSGNPTFSLENTGIVKLNIDDVTDYRTPITLISLFDLSTTGVALKTLNFLPNTFSVGDVLNYRVWGSGTSGATLLIKIDGTTAATLTFGLSESRWHGQGYLTFVDNTTTVRHSYQILGNVNADSGLGLSDTNTATTTITSVGSIQNLTIQLTGTITIRNFILQYTKATI